MIELRLPISPALVDPLEEWFNELQRCSWGLTTDPTASKFELFGYFDDEASAQEAWKTLSAAFPALPKKPTQSLLDDRDWKEAYKAHLRPWSTGDLHWVPVWLKDVYPMPAGHTRLLFDAGMAFGTGDHPTTRLMAQRLLDFRAVLGPKDFATAKIIDAGCGSGILALSAALLGAKNVFAFDRDPEAVVVSRENLVFNGLPENAVALDNAGLEAALKGRTADLILANIQADVLSIHADDLAKATAPGGTLAMSGILAAEVNDVRAAFEPNLAHIWKYDVPDELELFGSSRVMGDWCDLVFERPAR